LIGITRRVNLTMCVCSFVFSCLLELVSQFQGYRNGTFPKVLFILQVVLTSRIKSKKQLIECKKTIISLFFDTLISTFWIIILL